MTFAEKPSPRAADEHGISESAVAPGRASFQSADPVGFDQDERARAAARSGRSWWVLAGISALLLTGLTAAAVYLLTKNPSTADQVVILTVPSGAEIKLDSN